MVNKRKRAPYGYSPSAWKLIGRGIELGLIIGGLTYLGHLGDERWGTGPWLMLVGAVLATLGGSYNIVKDMLFPKKGNPPPRDTGGSDESQDRGPQA